MLPPSVLGTIPLQQWWTIADCSSIQRASHPSAVVPNDGRPTESVLCTHRAAITLRDGSQGSVKLGTHTTAAEVIAGLAAQISLVNTSDFSLFALDTAGAQRMLGAEEELMDGIVEGKTASIVFRRRIAVPGSPLAREEASAGAIDAGAHYLAFLDAARQLREGEFELSEESAVHLAALHLYSDFGEVIPDKFIVQAYVAPAARHHNIAVIRRIVAREHIAVCAELRSFPGAVRRLRAQRSFMALLAASQPLYGALATKVGTVRIESDIAADDDPVGAFKAVLALSPAGVFLLVADSVGERPSTVVHCPFDAIDGFTLTADGLPMLVLHVRAIGCIALARCDLRPRDLHRILAECAAIATKRGTTGCYAPVAGSSAADQPRVLSFADALEHGAFHSAQKSSSAAAVLHTATTMSFVAELRHRRDSLRKSKTLEASSGEGVEGKGIDGGGEGGGIGSAKGALPEGWTEHHDERSDRMYWYNTQSGASSWIKPTCSPRARARPAIKIGQLTAITEAPASSPMVSAADVPAGWEKTWSEQHGRFYFFSRAENRSAWSLSAIAAGPNPKAPPKEAPKGVKGGLLAGLAGSAAAVPAASTSTAAAAPVSTKAVLAMPGPMPGSMPAMPARPSATSARPTEATVPGEVHADEAWAASAPPPPHDDEPQVKTAATASPAKKKHVVVVGEHFADIDTIEAALPLAVHEKSPSTSTLLEGVLAGHFLFMRLRGPKLTRLVAAMVERVVAAGEVIARCGDATDSFYVLESGTAQIEGEETLLCAGDVFGELALMHNSETAATVTATEPTVLWELHRSVFRQFLVSTSVADTKSAVQTLRKSKLLQSLTPEQMDRVIAAASPHDFAAGDTIIKKGDTNGSALFIILEGNVVCTDIGDGDAEECPLAAGDYFGELALMGTGAPRAATVTARSPTTCMAVERAAFVRVVGTLAKVLETNAVVRTIRAAPSFRLLATDVLEYLVASCTETVVEHGGVFMRAGEKINGMVVCKSGELSYAGRVVAANQYFFESSLHSEEIVDEDVKVSGASPTEPARFLVIARDAVERMIGQPLAQYRGKEALTLASLQRAEGLGGGLGRRRSLALVMQQPPRLTVAALDDFELLRLLGVGMFGRVHLVRRRVVESGASALLALKIVRKSTVVKFRQTQAVMDEKAVLLIAAKHPFALKLVATFQDAANLYILTELLDGGELFAHQSRQSGGVFREASARFYGACVEAVLCFLHGQQICFRDVKPENVMLDRGGYVKLIDFGFAKCFAETGKCFTLCGTPEYLAPEVILGSGYTTSADVWAAGVLVFEMVVGHSPFAPDEPSQVTLCKRIVSKSVERPGGAFSDDAWKFVQGTLEREVATRLGCGVEGHAELKAHAWWAGGKAKGGGEKSWWTALERRQLDAPWVPPLKGDGDMSYFAEVEAEEGEEEEEVAAAEGGEVWCADF